MKTILGTLLLVLLPMGLFAQTPLIYQASQIKDGIITPRKMSFVPVTAAQLLTETTTRIAADLILTNGLAVVVSSATTWNMVASSAAHWNSAVYTELDPVFSASEAFNITASSTTDWNSAILTELDPVFSASEAFNITASSTTDWNSAILTELDPVFSASEAFNITASSTTDWNSALQAEVDPIFSASEAYGITVTSTTQWNSALTAETDPIFSASEAFNITPTSTTDWNDTASSRTYWNSAVAAAAALGITVSSTTDWNDTASSRTYWNSAIYTELDPVYSADEAFNITPSSTTDWNTAYGWGDHSLAGYQTESSSPTWSGAHTFDNPIGVECARVTSTMVASSASTANCGASRVLGGGCSASPMVAPLQGYPISDTTYRCESNVATSDITAYAICGKLE